MRVMRAVEQLGITIVIGLMLSQLRVTWLLTMSLPVRNPPDVSIRLLSITCRDVHCSATLQGSPSDLDAQSRSNISDFARSRPQPKSKVLTLLFYLVRQVKGVHYQLA